MVSPALHGIGKAAARIAAVLLFAVAGPVLAETSLPVLPGEDDRVMAETAAPAPAGLPALVQKIDAETAPLRQNYLLKVSTAQENYLVGQAAELVFTATTLDGKPLPDPKPWLDVVATWGRLRAAPGFVVRENAEENALAVQFNNAGQVRLQLRSQFTRGLTPSAEGSFAGVLQAQAGSSGILRTLNFVKYLPQQGWANEGIVSQGMIAAGFLWYIYARARLIYLKRKN